MASVAISPKKRSGEEQVDKLPAKKLKETVPVVVEDISSSSPDTKTLRSHAALTEDSPVVAANDDTAIQTPPNAESFDVETVRKPPVPDTAQKGVLVSTEKATRALHRVNGQSRENYEEEEDFQDEEAEEEEEEVVDYESDEEVEYDDEIEGEYDEDYGYEDEEDDACEDVDEYSMPSPATSSWSWLWTGVLLALTTLFVFCNVGTLGLWMHDQLDFELRLKQQQIARDEVELLRRELTARTHEMEALRLDGEHRINQVQAELTSQAQARETELWNLGTQVEAQLMEQHTINTELRAEISTLERERGHWKSLHKTLQSEQKQLQAQVSNLSEVEKDNKELQRKRLSAERETEHVRMQLQRLQTKHEDILEEGRALELEFVATRDKLIVAENEISQLRERVENNEEVQAEYGVARQAIDDMSTQLEQARRELVEVGRVRRNLELEGDNMRQRIADLERQTEELGGQKTELDRMTKRIEILETKNAKLTKKLADRD